MKPRLLPSLALAAVLSVSACAGEASDPQEAPRPEAAPVDTSIQPAPTGAPSPDAPTPPPGGAVTAANLPQAQDLQWSEETSWQVEETFTGGGTEQLSVCQQNSIESLGVNAIQVRTFTLGEDGEAVAIAMSFDGPGAAEEGYALAEEWVGDCEQVLAAQQRTDGRQHFPAAAVTLPALADGESQVTEWIYSPPDSGGHYAEFESQGLVRSGDRMAFVIMRVQGQDNSWDLEPGGPVGDVHPMIRSLPAVADRLAQ